MDLLVWYGRRAHSNVYIRVEGLSQIQRESAKTAPWDKVNITELTPTALMESAHTRTESERALLLEKSIPMDQVMCDRISGIYGRSGRLTLTFVERDKEIWVQGSALNPSGKLLAVTEDQYELLDLDIGFRFIFSDTGRATRCLFRFGQASDAYDRIEDE